MPANVLAGYEPAEAQRRQVRSEARKGRSRSSGCYALLARAPITAKPMGAKLHRTP
jgi:hypothetical protein